MLIKAEADLNQRTRPRFPDGNPCTKAGVEAGDTPLHCAARFGSVAFTRLLLKARADPQSRNDRNETPLGVAKRQHPEVAEAYNVLLPHLRCVDGDDALLR